MTDVQLAQCKTCLNRKKGTLDPLDICNIRGFQPKDDEACPYFEQDKQVVPETHNKLLYLKPNDKRAKYAIIAILVVSFFAIINVLSSYMQYRLLIDLKNGVYVSDELLTSNDSREQITSIFYLISYIISGVFFILWFRRAYYNLDIRTDNCEYSEGWAAGCWFVPIICLVRPYKIMLELDNDTTDLLEKATKKEINTNATLIGIWWTMWIVITFLGNTVFKVFLRGETVNHYINITILELITSFLILVLGMVTIFMVKNYADKEAALVAEEQKMPEPQPENLTQ
ncbi:DUF4328 domain-containing protein [Flavobacterium sp.]|uniref:DUF4328 domain-containing protein n=1 Tax=Flavobacterium sp. TaxID=239 RepID=UPI00262FBC54|nr:DUF4328 domain-containing protein [Flavobacterium sp.]